MNRTKFHVYTFVGSLPWCLAPRVRRAAARASSSSTSTRPSRSSCTSSTRSSPPSSWWPAPTSCVRESRATRTIAERSRPRRRGQSGSRRNRATILSMAQKVRLLDGGIAGAYSSEGESPDEPRGDPQGACRLARRLRRDAPRRRCRRASLASRPGATSTSPTSSRPRTSPSTTCETSGCPGEYPFTRGVQPTMYRGRLWTMRMFAGLRHARADERALQVPARAGADRPLDRLRFPDPHGVRLRQPARRSARSACAASRSTRCATWRSSSRTSRSTRSRRR